MVAASNKSGLIRNNRRRHRRRHRPPTTPAERPVGDRPGWVRPFLPAAPRVCTAALISSAATSAFHTASRYAEMNDVAACHDVGSPGHASDAQDARPVRPMPAREKAARTSTTTASSARPKVSVRWPDVASGRAARCPGVALRVTERNPVVFTRLSRHIQPSRTPAAWTRGRPVAEASTDGTHR
jgi:hypothetical protein